MKTPNLTLKLATLASSGLLVAGLIAFQSGAFDRLIHANESSTIERPRENTNNDLGQSQTSAKEADVSAQAEKLFLPGSKSAGAIRIVGSTVTTEAPPQTASEAAKSASDTEKSDDGKPKRSFLPGSKAPITAGRR